MISMSHRPDHKSVRIIYGNDKAIEAARVGKTGVASSEVVWCVGENFWGVRPGSACTEAYGATC